MSEDRSPPKRSPDFYRALHERVRDCSAEDFLYLLCKIDDSNEFRTALHNRTCICPAEEFKKLLMIFGEKQAALAIFQKALESRAQLEGRYSQGDKPTAAQTNYAAKRNLLIDCHLHMGVFRGVFNDVADPPENNLIKLFKDELAVLSKTTKTAKADSSSQPKAPKVALSFKPVSNG